MWEFVTDVGRGQCKTFGEAAKMVDKLIDNCGLPAVPIDEVEDETKYFRWLLDRGYLDELTSIKVMLQRIEERLDGPQR
jgi:hypothetical protein